MPSQNRNLQGHVLKKVHRVRKVLPAVPVGASASQRRPPDDRTTFRIMINLIGLIHSSPGTVAHAILLYFSGV